MKLLATDENKYICNEYQNYMTKSIFQPFFSFAQNLLEVSENRSFFFNIKYF